MWIGSEILRLIRLVLELLALHDSRERFRHGTSTRVTGRHLTLTVLVQVHRGRTGVVRGGIVEGSFGPPSSSDGTEDERGNHGH